MSAQEDREDALATAYDLGWAADAEDGATDDMDEAVVVAFYQGKEDRMAARIDAAAARLSSSG